MALPRGLINSCKFVTYNCDEVTRAKRQPLEMRSDGLGAYLTPQQVGAVVLFLVENLTTPGLCQCGREGQPIVVEDGEREESSPSSYQTPPVASLDENQEPIPVRIATMREGQLVPVVEQEEIDELFWAINREHDSQEELSVCSPNRQRRRVRVRRRAQLHVMSTAVDVQPRIPLRRIDGVKGAVQRDRSLRVCCYFDRLNHKFGAQKCWEERGVSSGYAPHLNLGWIHSRTMARMRQVLVPYPVVPWSESILQHCAESTFMLTPDNIRGRLTETLHGPGLSSDFTLKLTIPLSDEDGTRFLSMLVGNRMESPQWKEGSHEEEGF